MALFVAGKDLFVSKKTRCIAKLYERYMPSPRLSAEGVFAAELGAHLVRASIWVGTDRVIISKTFRYVEHLRLRDERVHAVECYFGGQGGCLRWKGGRNHHGSSALS